MTGPAIRRVPWVDGGIEYVKYHASGNDYLVVDPARSDVDVDSALVRRLCDRRRGVGADGVLLGPGTGNGFRLTVVNADGSECPRSGNGVRIFARYLVDSGHTTRSTFVVRTASGPSTVSVLDRDDVELDLGRASFDGGAGGPARSVREETLVLDGDPWSFTVVHVGTTHVVVPCGDEDVTPARAGQVAEALRADDRFPRGVNVALAAVLGPDDVRIEIVERAAGRTPASGSSAAAAVAACRERGLVSDRVTVHMPGGRVRIAVGPDGRMTLRGPVSPVAAGRWPAPAAVPRPRADRAPAADDPPVAGPAEYPLRRWMFDDAAGRYDIDLGGSNAAPRTAGDLGPLPDLPLGYGSDRGGETLRGLVADLYGRSPDEVGVAHGAQEALYVLHRTLIRPGDHVVVVGPGWPQSRYVPRATGAAVDVVPDGPDGRPDVAGARRLLGPRTRLVVLTSPANPFGRRADDRAVDDLVPELRRRGTYLIADEEYQVDLAGASLLHRYERAISVSGLSKLYGLPGLRTGWMCGPRSVVDEAMTYKHWVTIANSVLTEQLASTALRGGAARRRSYQEAVATGTDILRRWAADRPELEMTEPDGTPFVWLTLAGRTDALDLCRALLDAGVLVMPAEVFGLGGGIRVTVARRPEDLVSGLDRIARVLDRRTDPPSPPSPR